MSYVFLVKSFDWSEEKNEKLLLERGLSFEQIVLALEEGGLLDVLEHPNQEKYRGQRLMVVRIGNYAVLVPFIEDAERVFLKTIIPSRKATKAYLTRGGGDDD